MKILKILRKYKGLTQAELAERVGVSRNHLSLIENEHKSASVDLLVRICDEIHCNPCLILCSRFKNEFLICQACGLKKLKNLSDEEKMELLIMDRHRKKHVLEKISKMKKRKENLKT